MEKEDRERLVRVEVGITTLTEAVTKHMEADCDKLGCVLHDDVVSLKATQKTASRLSWTAIVGVVGLVLRYAWKGVMNV